MRVRVNSEGIEKSKRRGHHLPHFAINLATLACFFVTVEFGATDGERPLAFGTFFFTSKAQIILVGTTEIDLGPIITFVSVDKINVLCITRDERLVVLLDQAGA
jgi:hypothetical protein